MPETSLFDLSEFDVDPDAESLRLQLQIERDDLMQIMSNASGRRWMFWLLAEARVFHSSFSSCALDMSRREGRRQLGLLVLERIHQWCPDRYHQMIQESISGRRRNSARGTQQHT